MKMVYFIFVLLFKDLCGKSQVYFQLIDSTELQCLKIRMGLRWTRFFYLIVNFLSVFGLKLPQQPDPGFRYNCWDQTCTFPSQYCDIDEKRCLFCSDDLCKSGNFPEQCYSYCQGNLIFHQRIQYLNILEKYQLKTN